MMPRGGTPTMLPWRPMDDDFALLDRWAAGDKRAANSLLERHFDAIYRFFKNKASHGVDDLVQDTFTACIGARERFRRDASFRTFLFATARNVLFEHYRRGRRAENDTEIGESSIAMLDPTPSAIVCNREEQRLLLEALRALP